MPHMVTKMVDGLFVGVHNANTPTDAEWAAYLGVCEQMLSRQEAGGAPCRQLIVTDGGGPSLDQRRAAQRLTHHRGGRVAVVSKSIFVRFAVKALTFTNPAIRVFAPDRLDDALSYLGVNEPRATIEQLILALRAQLTWPTPPPPKRPRRRGPLHTD